MSCWFRVMNILTKGKTTGVDSLVNASPPECIKTDVLMVSGVLCCDV